MANSTETKQAAPTSPDPYQLRKELAQVHKPANAHEEMLVTQIAQSWIRLQQAQQLEREYFDTRNILEVVKTKLEEFKAVTRFTTDCERAWRHAVRNLEVAQRRRQKAAGTPAKAAPQHVAKPDAPLFAPAAAAPARAAAAPVAIHRE